MSKYILELNKVNKKIGRKHIIKNLSLSINKGEIYGLLGPNGAGKTTTIRMIVGLISSSSGNIVINGHNVKSNFEKAILNVGGIVENPEMYKYLTGYQNLVHYGRMVPGVTEDRIKEVISLIRLENRIHDKVKRYSLGMRQRLGVAQALLHRPGLLILDEPTNGLDPAGIHELRDYLRQLVEKENISVLVSSHLLAEMEIMCDRVAIIQNGELLDILAIEDFSIAREKQYMYQLEVRNTIDNYQLGEILNLTLLKNEKSKESTSLLQFMCAKEDIPSVIHKLSAHSIDIYSIKMITPTLEQKFLEITGGGHIV